MSIQITTGSRIQITVGSDGTGTGVTSVNGQTGTVTLAIPTTEQIQDLVAAMLVAGSNVSLTYDDTAGTLTVASTGGGGGGLDAEGAQDAVGTIMAGAGLATVAYSDGTPSITVTVTSEAVQDVVGAMTAAGSGVSVTYDDPAGTVTITNTDRGSVAVSSHVAATDPHGDRAYTDAAIAAAIAALLDGAPGALDTLNELAAAVNDDASFAASVTTALAGKASTARLIAAGTGLTGGGSLAADRTLAIDTEWLLDYLATTLLAGTGITATYNDTLGTITFAATGGSSSTAVTLINGEYGTEPVTASSPPTITVTATSSPTSGNTRIAPNGATVYTYPGVDVVSAGTVGGLTNCVTQTGIDVSPSGVPYNLMAVEFETDAPTVDVFLYGTSNSAANGANCAFYSIEVDGEFITADPVATALGETAWNRVTIPFGSVKRRRIIVRSQYTQFGGVAVDATKYKVWRSARNPGPKTIVFMDSFGTGGSSTDATFATPAVLPWVWGSYAIKAGRILGWNTFPSPVGGTSWFYDGGFGQSVASRYDTDGHARLPDQVVFAIGLNDRAQTLSSVQTAINNTIQAAAATVNAQGRKTRVFALAPFCTVDSYGTTFRTALTTIAGYVSTACATYGGTYIAGPLDYISGTGWVGGTTGDGNADIYVSPDRIHLMPAGYDYIGRRLASEIAEASRANRIGNQALDSGLIVPGHTVEDEGSAVTQRTSLNFVGSGVTVTDSGGKTTVTIPGGGGGLTVQDENSNVATGVTQIDFQGAGVTTTTGSGEVVVTIPGGGTPSRNGCSLYRTADYSWTPTTGYETVPWTAELFDDASYHDNSTNNDRITIPAGAGGTYEFTANIHVSRASMATVQVRIKKNGSTASDIPNMLAGAYPPASGVSVVHVTTGPVVLAANDHVTVEVFPDGSGTATVNKDWSWFRMKRIA